MHNHLFILFSYVVFIIFGFGLFNFSDAQNCAIPQIVSLPFEPDVKTECAASGIILANLTTKHIKRIRNVSQSAENFVHVDFNPSTGIILLVVDEPLYSTSLNANFTGKKTFIDETWNKNVEVHVEFECSDGHTKIVTFHIPIVDINSQPPVFEQQSYSLSTGPCYNGTHSQSCPLNFETSILVFDADRDFENAAMGFQTNATDVIHQITSSVVTEVDNKLIGTTPNHHILAVRLYLKESPNFRVGNVFSFTLTAYNKRKGPLGERWSTDTLVTISFVDSPNIGNSTILRPPVFNSKAYYAIVAMSNVTNGSELLSLQPSKISTKLISGLGYGDGYIPAPDNSEESDESIVYDLKSDILKIDPYTGTLFFTQNIIDMSNELLYPTHRMYEITASVESYEFLKATVPLIVFLMPWQNDSITEPPVCITTPPPTCPDCPITCPPTEGCPDITTTSPDGGTSETNDDSSSTTTDSYSSSETTLQTLPFQTSTTTTNPPITNNPIITTNPSITTTHLPTTTNPTTTTTNPTTTTTSRTTPELPNTSSSTVFPNGTSTSTTLSTPTTSVTWQTTDINPTTDASTPQDDICCPTCQRIPDFKCPSGEYNLNIFLPDPHECDIYYQCRLEQGVLKPNQFKCEQHEVFCPEKQICVSPSECSCIDFPPDDQCNGTSSERCEPCEDCIDGWDPRNVCNDSEQVPSNSHISDPKYYDVFHTCEKHPLAYGYRDCLLQCPKGLVFCESSQRCDFQSDCSKGDRIPYRCDPCSNYYMSRGIILDYGLEFGFDV